MSNTQRLVVDPVTRMEGHMRIGAQTDADGKIIQAYSAGTMVRGIEIRCMDWRRCARLRMHCTVPSM
jgi:Ni,Fe-hydrogenase I large subunit